MQQNDRALADGYHLDGVAASRDLEVEAVSASGRTDLTQPAADQQLSRLERTQHCLSVRFPLSFCRRLAPFLAVLPLEQLPSLNDPDTQDVQMRQAGHDQNRAGI